jgi:lipoprotein-anchoring transpeptidase ErfK/SrfK
MARSLQRIRFLVGLAVMVIAFLPQGAGAAPNHANMTIADSQIGSEDLAASATLAERNDATQAVVTGTSVSALQADTTVSSTTQAATSRASAAEASATQSNASITLSASVPVAPLPSGRVIYVSRARQWVYAYLNGHLVFSNAVETGRLELPTPSGHFSVLSKGRNLTFTSPWPKGSPNYYFPTHINYALMFKSGGFFLHDAWWHCTFGPGSNVNHWTSGCPGWTGGHWETGSHGCIGMSISDARRLYDWATVGTPVIVA